MAFAFSNHMSNLSKHLVYLQSRSQIYHLSIIAKGTTVSQLDHHSYCLSDFPNYSFTSLQPSHHEASTGLQSNVYKLDRSFLI